MNSSDEPKKIKDLMPTVVEKLSRLQSEDQPQSTVSKTVEASYECRECGKTWTVKSDKYAFDCSFSSECRDCRHLRREREFEHLCPSLYRQTDLNRLPAKQLKEALDWQYSSKGLLMIGDTGVGKTRIAWSLLKRVLVEDKKELSFDWFDSVGFGHEISRHYRSEDAEDWLEKMSRKDLLFFDDLGKLKMTERAETELFGLIERRCARELPIIATTNDTGDSLAARMTDNRGPAMIRRLREFCQIIHFPATL